jgi:hypothetical protein
MVAPHRLPQPGGEGAGQEGNADGRDVTKRVCYDRWGLPLYPLRRFTVRLPW